MALWMFVCGVALVSGVAFLRQRLRMRRERTRREESEAWLQQVLHHSREAIYSYDIQQQSFLYLSPACLRLAGLSCDEVRSLSLRDMLDRVHPDDLERMQRLIHALKARLAGGEWSGLVEYRLMHRDGHYRSMSDYMHIQYDESGAAAQVNGAVREVTQISRLEDNLRTLEKRFEEGQKMAGLGLLASGIAHDFNNLMTVILGNTELALLDCGGSDGDVLDEIKCTTLRAAELANQMLVYTGKTSMVIGSINLSRVVHEMGALLDVSISKKVKIEYCLSDTVRLIRGDVSQVRQVAMNLITNASEAIGDRPGVIAVSIHEVHLRPGELKDAFPAGSSPEGDFVRLEVSDTGCGMDEHVRQQIFAPQFTTKVSGRGLGLASLLNAVERHNGAVEVSSKVGAGTVFRVYFPVEEVRAEEVLLDEEGGEDSWRAYGTTLIADDESAVLNVTAELMRRQGFHVLTASDGMKAVEVFTEHAEDITFILMDVNMPSLNGIEAVQRIRHIKPSVPVLFMSGYPRGEVLQRFEHMPCTGYIKKPFRRDGLIRTVCSVLASKPDEESVGC